VLPQPCGVVFALLSTAGAEHGASFVVGDFVGADTGDEEDVDDVGGHKGLLGVDELFVVRFFGDSSFPAKAAL